MRLLSLLLLFCLWAFMAVAQQSIEIKPGQMTFKGQGADLNDRLTSNANGVANFKTKQEVIVLHNYFAPGGPQSFLSRIPTKMDLDLVYHEKKNNTTSNVNATDDTILIEETGTYLIDVNTYWPTTFAGDIMIKVLSSGLFVESFYARRTADDPNYQRFTGTAKLTGGDRIYLELTQTNSTNTARSANFSVSVTKL